ncbi:hypothetical protein SAMN05192583_2851 [Sphingomonas gellani]|uniref:Uncharacterized protein n=1 Tax=Sphingomonas gellani TaxID=1166340 RepID=A0A1H8GQH4_9SPHN|nr:hypothetical protein [Sphingomonas gellani]SEN46055.1 hypothetical protein SAMN05192583_2851 [Sphingomonas gellani]
MLKTRIRREVANAERIAARLAAIEASVVALANEDLLDLADIFAGDKETPLWTIAAAEMQKRNIRL